MKKLRNIKILVLAVTVMLCVGATINAQSRKTVPAKWIEEDKWITYAAPDKTFSIRVPETLEHERTKVTDRREVSVGFDELTLSKCGRSIDYYYLRSMHRGDRDRLVMRVINIEPCKDKWEELKEVEDSFVSKIAGTAYGFDLDRPINFDGLYGRKILYKSGSFYPGAKDSAIYNEVFTIRTGSLLYIGAYYRGEGTIGEAFSIFQSLSPNICLN